MNKIKLLQIIRSPHVTEKTSTIEKYSQYAFKVESSATKSQVKAAVESLWGVQVQSVGIVSVKPKRCRVGRYSGYKKAWKKAYVSLKQGQTIDLLS